MILEEYKYRAEVFKIAGFSFMAPLGKLILSIPDFNIKSITVQSMVFIIVALVSLYFGIILILRGLDMTIEKERK